MHPSFKEHLRPLQIEGASFLSYSKWAILADDMGLGKSVQSLAHAHSQGGKTLIVAPSYLKLNWVDEIEKWWPELINFNVDKDATITITSYSKMKKHPELFEGRKNIIFDEAHYLKNVQAQRTKLAHNLIRSNKPENLSLLTGTPITNHVVDYYSPLRMLSYCPYRTNGKPLEGSWIKNRYNFCYAFSNPITKHFGGRRVTVFEGHNNVDLLRELLVGKYKRRTKAQVKGMPKKQRNFINLATHWAGDKDIKDIEDVINRADHPHFMSFRVQVANEKVPYTVKFCNNILEQGQGPILLLTDFIEPFEKLKDAFPGRRVAAIRGGMKAEERHRIVTEFQKGAYDVLVATIRAVQFGLNMTKSNKVVFNDFSYNPASNLQAEDRVCRIGQLFDCDIYYMLYGRVDNGVIRRLAVKADTIANTVAPMKASRHL